MLGVLTDKQARHRHSLPDLNPIGHWSQPSVGVWRVAVTRSEQCHLTISFARASLSAQAFGTRLNAHRKSNSGKTKAGDLIEAPSLPISAIHLINQVSLTCSPEINDWMDV